MKRRNTPLTANAWWWACALISIIPAFGLFAAPAPSVNTPANIKVLSQSAQGMLDVVESIRNNFADFLAGHAAFKNALPKVESTARAVIALDGQKVDNGQLKKTIDAFIAAVDDVRTRANGFASNSRQSAQVRSDAKAISDMIEALNIPTSAATANDSSSTAASKSATTTSKPLTSQQLSALVFIEGDKGRGTGFVTKLHDKPFIVTNLHVLSGNSKITITGMDGTKYPTNGDLFAAQDCDVAILSISDPKNWIEVVSNDNEGVEVNDVVTVPGNAEGANVATQVNGKVLGIGPSLVEVDAKFVQGNSGSPIIHRGTGKVIGVATFATVYKLDDLKTFANARSVRWFGYRLDNIKDWEKLDWQKFTKDGQGLEQIEEMTDWLIAFLRTGQPGISNDANLNKAAQEYLAELHRAAQDKSNTEVSSANQRFLTSLKDLSDANLRLVANGKLCAYHAKLFKEQQEARAAIVKILQEELNYDKILSSKLR